MSAPSIKSRCFLQFLLLFSFSLNAQQNNNLPDSIKVKLAQASHDSDKLLILQETIDIDQPYATWEPMNSEMQRIAVTGLKKVNNKKDRMWLIYNRYIGESYFFQACNYRQLGDIKKSIDYFTKSLKIYESIDDKIRIAYSLNNFGTIYDDQGDTAKAIEYYKKSLKIKEELKDKKGMATGYNNLGYVYKNNGDYKRAEEYYRRSLGIMKELDYKRGIGQALNNLGMLHKTQQQNDSAIKYYLMAQSIFEKAGIKPDLAAVLTNLAGYLWEIK